MRIFLLYCYIYKFIIQIMLSRQRQLQYRDVIFFSFFFLSSKTKRSKSCLCRMGTRPPRERVLVTDRYPGHEKRRHLASRLGVDERTVWVRLLSISIQSNSLFTHMPKT